VARATRFRWSGTGVVVVNVYPAWAFAAIVALGLADA
jgi:hypothetical protein